MPPRKRAKPAKKKTPKKNKTGPSPNGNTGQDSKGRFTKGNKLGKGNPHAKRVGELRSAFFEAVTKEDMLEVVKALVRKAKKGDVHAIKELLLRVLGQYQPGSEPQENEHEDWLSRTSLSDGSYLVVPAGTDVVEAYHAHIRAKKPKASG